MPITVRYFAAARDLAGCSEEAVELEEEQMSQAALRALLAGKHPRLEAYLARMRLALNDEFAEPSAMIHDGDEVGILPPVAGGSGVVRCEIIDEPLSVDTLYRSVAHDRAGGIAIFTGVVRNHSEGKPVARLEYESHRELAQRELRRILEAIVTEQPEVRISAVHRVGSLTIGDLAVVIAASAPHRAQAFAACRAAIERIKETVPIWKKEWGPDGEAEWVDLES